MTAEQFAAQLDAKRHAEGWTARCPAHPDERPSLSIGEGAHGRVLLKCHAQRCDPAAIVAAVGLTLKDIAGSEPKQPTPARKTIATYDYEDETHGLLSQVVRYEPKDFRQRRPDG